MGTVFSACKTGMDRMNVTSAKQLLSLLCEMLLQSQNSSVLLKEMLVLWLYPDAQRSVGQNQYFYLK